jgi:hypothetical protein
MSKRKPTPPPRPASGTVELAAAPEPETGRKGRRGRKCHVCGGEVAAFTSEDLCWVCRRLKISAWRENDNQAAMQE